MLKLNIDKLVTSRSWSAKAEFYAAFKLRDGGIPDLKQITGGPWLVCHRINESEMVNSFGVHGLVRPKST